MDPHRVSELREKRARLKELRRRQAEAVQQHEARFGASGDDASPTVATSPGAPVGKLGELEELFAEALRQQVTTVGSIDSMRRHIKTGRFTPDHYIDMWRTRLGLAAPAPAPARASQQRPRTPPSVASMQREREREREERAAAQSQADLDDTLAQIAPTNRAGGARKAPPPALPPPPPPPVPAYEVEGMSSDQRSGGGGGGGGAAAGGGTAEGDLLAGIRARAGDRGSARQRGVAELEGRMQERRGSGSDAHAAQLSDALSGLRRQMGPGGSDSDGEQFEQTDEDEEWLSDDEPTQASDFHWARPRVATGLPVPAPAPAPAPAPQMDLSPGVRQSRSRVRESHHAQEPDWLAQRQPPAAAAAAAASAELEVERPVRRSRNPVQQAQARVLSDPELHQILARRRATTDQHAIVVATPESVTAIDLRPTGTPVVGGERQRDSSHEGAF